MWLGGAGASVGVGAAKGVGAVCMEGGRGRRIFAPAAFGRRLEQRDKQQLFPLACKRSDDACKRLGRKAHP